MSDLSRATYLYSKGLPQRGKRKKEKKERERRGERGGGEETKFPSVLLLILSS